MREGSKEIERRPVLGSGHLGTVFLHEAVPFALALRVLRELDQSGAGGERWQPHIIEVLGRMLTLLHASRRPPHRADAKALARGSIRAESNYANAHCGSDLEVQNKMILIDEAPIPMQCARLPAPRTEKDAYNHGGGVDGGGCKHGQ